MRFHSILGGLLVGLIFSSGCGSGGDDQGPQPTPDATQSSSRTTGGTPGGTAPVGTSEQLAEQAVTKLESVVAVPGSMDVSYIAPKFQAALVIHPRRILESDMLKSLPQDFVMEYMANEGEFYFDLREVEEIVFLRAEGSLEQDGEEVASHYLHHPIFGWRFPPIEDTASARIIRLSQTLDEQKVLESVYGVWFSEEQAPAQRTYKGLSYYVGNRGPYIFVGKDNAIVMTEDEELLHTMMFSKDETSPLVNRLKTINADHDVFAVGIVDPIVGFVVDRMMQEIEQKDLQPPFPPAQMQLLQSVGAHLASVAVFGNIAADDLLKVTIEAKSPAGATELEELAHAWLGRGKEYYGPLKEQFKKQLPPFAAGNFQKGTDIADRAVDGIQVATTGREVTLTLPNLEGLDALAQEVKPALESAEAAAKRARNVNQLRFLSITLFHYQDRNPNYPNNIYDDEGKPLLSWRVRLVPLMDDVPGRPEFKLDEPWDSPHNIKLLKYPPSLLVPTEDGKVRVLAFDTELAPSGVKGKGLRSYENVKDGFANTVAFVLVGPDKAVPWTKPVDVAFDPKNPVAGLGDVSGGIDAIFMDGSYKLLPADISPEKLKALITFEGGEEVEK